MKESTCECLKDLWHREKRGMEDLIERLPWSEHGPLIRMQMDVTGETTPVYLLLREQVLDDVFGV